MKTPAYNTLDRVKEALMKSRYGDDVLTEIITAKFQGWNINDEEVHTITLSNEDGGTSIGSVYIDKEGKGGF